MLYFQDLNLDYKLPLLGIKEKENLIESDPISVQCFTEKDFNEVSSGPTAFGVSLGRTNVAFMAEEI